VGGAPMADALPWSGCEACREAYGYAASSTGMTALDQYAQAYVGKTEEYSRGESHRL